MGNGEARRKGSDLDSDYSSAGDPQGEESSTSSSPSPSKAGSDDDGGDAPPSANEETDETSKYAPMKLQMMGVPFSPDSLRDEDNELWLVRLPRYDAFVQALDDRDIHVMDEKGRIGTKRGGITGRLKGYYVFRDNGEVNTSERAVFVTKDADGGEMMEIAKPFARSMQVTFDAPLKNRSGKAPPTRKYPVAPTGLTLKYRPIGSETASAPTTSKGSIFSASPTRKRKLSEESDSETSEPATLELDKASLFSGPSKKRQHSNRPAGEGSLLLTPEQKSPSRSRPAAIPEERSPIRQGSLSLNGKESIHQGKQKFSRRKKSESKRRVKELT